MQTVTQRATWRWIGSEALTKVTSLRTTQSPSHRWECEIVWQLVRMWESFTTGENVSLSLTILKLDQLNILTQFNLLCPVRLHGSIPRGIHRRNCGRSSTQHWIKNMVSKLFVKTYKSLGKCDTGEFPGVIMTIVLRRKIQYHLLQVGIFT